MEQLTDNTGNIISRFLMMFFTIMVLMIAGISIYRVTREPEPEIMLGSCGVIPPLKFDLKVFKWFPVHITVGNANTPGEGTGSISFTGYKFDPNRPEKIVGTSRAISTFIPDHSIIYLKCPNNPIIEGYWRVEERSSLQGYGIEIMIGNPHVVTLGGSWTGQVALVHKPDPFMPEMPPPPPPRY